MFGIELPLLVCFVVSSSFFLFFGLFLIGSRDCVPCLSVCVCTQDGNTPLHLACFNGYDKIVGVLVTAGVELEAKTNVRRGLGVGLSKT